ncbi:MAG: metalloregulator ArsR/SmtB family transcription factor [Nitrospirae bacterium]|nr:metalloregulator ArsR/SmtB family transcription factor [Nitrospirota bacterium]
MAHPSPKSCLKFFKAVCDDHRHKILEHLKKLGKVNAGDIVKKVKLSQPTVSHHLKILCEAKIINSEKKGKEVFYSLNEDSIHNCCHSFMNRFSCKKKKC